MSEASEPASEPARGGSARLTLAAIALVLVGVPWAFKLGMAQELGKACGGGFDCAALDGRCVVGEEGRFCTVVCESDADCPDTGHCGVPPHDAWRVWHSASELSEQVCVPGARPAVPPKAGPMPEQHAE